MKKAEKPCRESSLDAVFITRVANEPCVSPMWSPQSSTPTKTGNGVVANAITRSAAISITPPPSDDEATADPYRLADGGVVIMRRLSIMLVPLLLVVFQSPAQGVPLQLDVTYTDGHIVSGPLEADLTALPASVHTVFTVNGSAAEPGTYGLRDLLAASLAFGDGAWSLGNLESFSTAFAPSRIGLAVTSLTYTFAPIDTPTVLARLAANFPLTIEGTDRATGEAFHYQYDTSTQTVTAVSEPSSLALAAFGVGGLLAWGWRRAKRL